MTGNRGNGDVEDEAPVSSSSEPTGLAAVEPEPAPPATPEAIDALRRERDELKDQLLRRRADFDNLRKRMERDRAQAGVDSAAALLQALIPSLDNLDRALETDSTSGPLRQGVELIQKEIQSVLESQGVLIDDPRGHAFDPERHQALSHEAAPGFEDGTVVQVFRKGYSFKGRLLRPALVKVAKEHDGGPDTGTDGPDSATH
jgi:molecular chaperone GrpE